METMGYESAGELLERTKDYLFDRSMPGALMTGFENLDLIRTSPPFILVIVKNTLNIFFRHYIIDKSIVF